jgi:hypothetical protein
VDFSESGALLRFRYFNDFDELRGHLLHGQRRLSQPTSQWRITEEGKEEEEESGADLYDDREREALELLVAAEGIALEKAVKVRTLRLLQEVLVLGSRLGRHLRVPVPTAAFHSVRLLGLTEHGMAVVQRSALRKRTAEWDRRTLGTSSGPPLTPLSALGFDALEKTVLPLSQALSKQLTALGGAPTETSAAGNDGSSPMNPFSPPPRELLLILEQLRTTVQEDDEMRLSTGSGRGLPKLVPWRERLLNSTLSQSRWYRVNRILGSVEDEAWKMRRLGVKGWDQVLEILKQLSPLRL